VPAPSVDATPLRILLEGRPGSGKSTVARRVLELLEERNVRVRGFVTDEIRKSGRREGFLVETTDGDRATLAHVRLRGPPRVGRYGVDLEAFERAVLPVLDDVRAGEVILLDELGKMELASVRFRHSVECLFENGTPIVATVHVFRHPFTDALKRRRGVEVITVGRRNRDQLPEQIAERLSPE
jgi:nucleoside-triphosphatase